MNMTQMSLAMRHGETIAWKDQAKLVVALSIPAVLEQLVMTMMSYIDTAMVGSLGYLATASIGVVASTIWLVNGIVNAAAVGFSVQIAQYLGAGLQLPAADDPLGTDRTTATASPPRKSRSLRFFSLPCIRPFPDAAETY